jgi:hypothetical protein
LSLRKNRIVSPLCTNSGLNKDISSNIGIEKERDLSNLSDPSKIKIKKIEPKKDNPNTIGLKTIIVTIITPIK